MSTTNNNFKNYGKTKEVYRAKKNGSDTNVGRIHRSTMGTSELEALTSDYQPHSARRSGINYPPKLCCQPIVNGHCSNLHCNHSIGRFNTWQMMQVRCGICTSQMQLFVTSKTRLYSMNSARVGVFLQTTCTQFGNYTSLKITKQQNNRRIHFNSFVANF